MQKRGANEGGRKVAAFFKRNIYYVLMVVCVIAIGAMITVAAVVSNNKDDQTVVVPPAPPVVKPEEPTVKPDVFVLQSPIDNMTMGKAFNNQKMLWDESSKSFKTHAAVDFKAAAGTDVKAVFGGVIEKVTTDGMYGTTLTIDHKNGYKSVYRLLSDPTVAVGQTINKGDTIGKVSPVLIFEKAEGEHIHLQLIKDGKTLDVIEFMPSDNK